MNIKKLLSLLSLAVACTLNLVAQQAAPTSGDVTVRLAEPVDFATARPLQAVRCSVVSSTNPAIPAGSTAVLQLQNRDGSNVLKIMRIVVPGQGVYRTMSQGGVAVSGPPASGPHASLVVGALVKFTLTQADGTPGAPMRPTLSTPSNAAAQPTVPAPTAPQPPSGDPSGLNPAAPHKHQMAFEGVALGMILSDVQAAAKANGGKMYKSEGGYTAMKTADADFAAIQFDDSGYVNSYKVIGIKRQPKSSMTSGPLVDLATKAFGAPAKSDSNGVTWGNPSKGHASAKYDWDSQEGPTGELIVTDGIY